jgi:DNA-binding transcriptional ArsR family regulator
METFSALADPVRLRIVTMLAAADMNVSEIATRFSVSRPAVSRHLSVLLRANLVQVRDQAQMRVYSLDPRGFDEVDRWMAQCRQIWSTRLDSLGTHLDNLARKRREEAKR